MNIITNFSTLHDLNLYYSNTIKYSLSNNIIFQLNSDSEYFSSLDYATQQTINNISSNYYIYPGSKTNFRKTVFPDIIESYYKKFYSALKTNSYILEASATRVIFTSNDITENVFTQINSHYNLYDDHLKILASIINRINDADSDILYYQKVIQTLLQRCSDLEAQLSDAYQQVHNKSISTWY